MKLPVFKKGQIVWAKVRGYPWWPSLVNENNQKKNGPVEKNVSLTFLAENKIGTVPTNKILEYEANFDKLSVIKNKKLQEAITIALREYGTPKTTIVLHKDDLNNTLIQSVEDPQAAEEEEKKMEEEENLNENEETRETAEIDDKDKDNTVHINISLEQQEKTPPVNEDKAMEEEEEEEEEEDIHVMMRPKRVEPKPKKEKEKEREKEKEALTKLEQKQKIKEEEKTAKHQDMIDLLQRRSTRSQAKTDQIEMFTEPLIYNHRKSKKSDKSNDKLNDNKSMIDENENNRLQSGVESELTAAEQEPTSQEKSPEKIQNDTKQNTKTEKTKLGKRVLQVKEEKDKKSANQNVSEDTGITEDDRTPPIVKEILKKVKVNPKTKEDKRTPIRGDQNTDLQAGGYINSAGASSSFNHMENNAESRIDHPVEFQSQSTSGNTDTLFKKSSQSPAKPSKRLDVKNVQVVSPSKANDALLRKSVCQKLAKILEEVYSMNKDSSQELTLYLEGRINSYFIGDVNYYKKVMKILYKLMKARMLKLEELKSIINFEYHEFKSWLQGKIETAITFQEEGLKPPANQTPRKNLKSSPTESDFLTKNDFFVEKVRHENNLEGQDKA